MDARTSCFNPDYAGDMILTTQFTDCYAKAAKLGFNPDYAGDMILTIRDHGHPGLDH